MAKCTNIAGNRRKACIGAMDKRITTQDRSITSPAFGGVDFDESFSAGIVRWAAINTVSGKTFFDSVNAVDVNITHEIIIRYDSAVTAETWILYDSRRFDIMNTEDMDERHEYMRLMCIDKGISKL